jgi:hypothetical protein
MGRMSNKPHRDTLPDHVVQDAACLLPETPPDCSVWIDPVPLESAIIQAGEVVNGIETVVEQSIDTIITVM